MRVVCDNCGATYKIPQTKLVKEVNKATCRKCGHRMLIRRAEDDVIPVQEQASHQGFRAAAAAAAAAAAVPRPEPAPRMEWEEEDPTHIAQLDERGEPRIPSLIPAPPPAVPMAAAPHAPALSMPAPAMPAPGLSSPAVPAPALSSPAPSSLAMAAPASAPRAPAPSIAPRAAAPSVPLPAPPGPTLSPAAAAPPAATRAFDPAGDIGVVGFGVVVAAIGGLLLAVNVSGGAALRFVGLFLALWGTLTALFIVVTGGRGRRKAGVVLSTVLGTLFAVVGAGAIVGVTSGAAALGSLGQDLAARTPPPAEPAATAQVDQRIDALFAEEPAAPPAGTALPPGDAIAEGTVPPPADPLAAAAPAATPAAATPARGAEPDSTSAYVAPPSEPARTTSSGSSGSSSAASTSRSTSSSGSTSTGSTSRTSTAPTTSTASTAPAEETSSGSGSSAGLSTLPPTVVDTMVKSNKNVKKCMYLEYKRSEGNLGTVTIRFKVLSSGKVSSAAVTSTRYKGTELDSCLSAAMYSVVFPAFSGETLTLDVTLGA